MNRVQAIEYDANFEIVERHNFEWVEDAMAWCESRAPKPLFWGDTQIGYEGMSEEDRDHLGDTGEYPPRIWQVHGLEDENDIESMREIEEGDHKGEGFVDNGVRK